MKLVSLSIRYPTAVAVGVILIVMFGLLALMDVPIQLTPDVDRPQITVQTTWLGASPQEIEREIVERQEKQLKSVEGLVRMTSESVSSRGRVILEFEVGTDTQGALLRVNNKLQQVPRYPENADKPVLISANQAANRIAWMVLLPTGENSPNIPRMRTFVEENVLPLIERTAGVAASELYGGQATEMQVMVDPQKVAAHKLTMRQVARALVEENSDFSAGTLDEGKRSYQVRTKSRLVEPGDADEVVVAYQDGAPVLVRDLGHTRIGHATPSSVVLHYGKPTMAMNAIRETGTNVLEVMAGLRQAITNINREVLADLGLKIQQVYDTTEYIVGAIGLVRSNIFVGGAMAICVLLLFLRSFSATLIIAISIPISLIGTFIMMSLFGRNLNVISLAGLAFASGMVLDAAIVVLENIYRRRQKGESGITAAERGATQVWGAILASTVTTVAVFLPVVRIKQEAGQLFADIAIAVSFAVIISLLVSITVIPSLASRLVRREGQGKGLGSRIRNSPPLAALASFGEVVRGAIVSAVTWLAGSTSARLGVVVLLTAASLSMAYFLAPKAEYLPTGNRNLVLGIMLPPPGYNVETISNVGEDLTKAWRDHWGPDPYQDGGNSAEPGFKTFFYVGWESQIFMGISSWQQSRAKELIPIMRETLSKVPGMISIVQQTSLFQQGASQGRTIDLDIMGPDLARLVDLGGRLFGQVHELLPDAQARPVPGLELAQPEVRFIPDRVRAAAVGLTAADIGFNLDVLVKGAKIDEVNQGGFNIDLTLMASYEQQSFTQDLGRLQVNTPQGRLVTLDSVAPPTLVGAPTQINHIERQRAITLRIYPSEEMPLQTAMEKLQAEIIDPLYSSGEIAPPYDVRLSGTADDLTQTYEALRGNFLLALAITFLLMAALFESFLYPLVIMFSVPLAAAGGFLGLWLVNQTLTYQPLDILTMLGFIILIGIVVNNAILIVDQTLRGLREGGLNIIDAVARSVKLRVRPIFMSTFTSIFGMLPLVVFPGAGSELYRGLGSVVLGGLLVSTVFTLFLVPSLLSLVLDMRKRLSTSMGREFKP